MYEESGRWADIGYIERTEVEVSDIKSSERVLARTVDEGMFAPADSGTADRVDYFDSSSDWDSYLKRRTNRRFVGDQAEEVLAVYRRAYPEGSPSELTSRRPTDTTLGKSDGRASKIVSWLASPRAVQIRPLGL